MKESQGFDQFGTAWDLRCDSGPDCYYAICMTPRSGSHFLGHLMYSTGEMGYPLEYFQPANLARWGELAGSKDISQIFTYIKTRRTSPNGCFGLKTGLASIKCYPFDELLPGCKLILIDRDDLLGQAISLVRASQTNQWISMQPPSPEPPHYNFQSIGGAISELTRLKEEWLHFFAASGRQFLKITYESLLADPETAIGRIAEYLSLPPVRIHWERVLPQKQSGEDSENWRRRFLEEADIAGRNS